MLYIWDVTVSSQTIRANLSRTVVAENMPAAIETALPLVRGGATEDDVVQVKRGEVVHGVAAS